MRQSLVLFFRLAVAELARREGRLSNLHPPDRGSRPCWEEAADLFGGIDAQLAGRPDLPRYRGLFSPDGLDGENRFLERCAPDEAALVGAVRAARLLAGLPLPPQAVLSGLYQHLLCYRPAVASGGGLQLRHDAAGRKASGSFYTPQPVARLVVEEALRPLIRRPSAGAPALPRTLDPAMGTGVFLLEAARYLADRRQARSSPRNGAPRAPSRTGLTAAQVAERSLYGVDRDPLAVELAILSLWLETGARPAVLAQRLRHGNLLLEDGAWPASGVDAVVGNPPWGARFSPAERERLAGRFPEATRHTVDSFKIFLHLASRVSDGTVGMVLPQAVLAQSAHADIRESVLQRMDPYFAAKLGSDTFPGAAAPACALVFGRKPGPRQVRCLRPAEGSRPAVKSPVPAALWRPAQGFPLEGRRLFGLLHRLQARHPTLRDLSGVYRVRDTGINYNRASVAARVLYTGPSAHDPRDVPRYRGRDFARYTPVRPGGWLRHNARSLLEAGEEISLDWTTYRLPEKIVLRQTADRIVATVDRSRMAMGRSVIAVTGDRSASLSALLACLNSSLLTALYRALAGEEGRILPQVKVGRVLMLPIPEACSSPLPAAPVQEGEAGARSEGGCLTSGTAETDPALAWSNLDCLAGLMLEREGEDRCLDALIDQTVYHLYGLSPEEVALVQEG